MAASTQSSPNFYYGFVPTPAQWIRAFQSKQDALGYNPVNQAGDTFTGPINFAPSTNAAPSLNIAPGAAPANPQNGDIWATTIGIFYKIGGIIYMLGGAVQAAPSGGDNLETVVQIATTPLPQHTVVKAVSGGVATASSSDTAAIGATLGITVTAATQGTVVTVQTSGEIDDSTWKWAPGPVFLGLDGALTQTVPTSGVLQTIGVSISPTALFIDIQDPTLRN